MHGLIGANPLDKRNGGMENINQPKNRFHDAAMQQLILAFVYGNREKCHLLEITFFPFLYPESELSDHSPVF